MSGLEAGVFGLKLPFEIWPMPFQMSRIIFSRSRRWVMASLTRRSWKGVSFPLRSPQFQAMNELPQRMLVQLRHWLAPANSGSSVSFLNWGTDGVIMSASPFLYAVSRGSSSLMQRMRMRSSAGRGPQ